VKIGSIHTLISDYDNLYSGLFAAEPPYSVAHFMCLPCFQIKASPRLASH